MLLALFNIVIQVFKDILSKIFAIPPCDDGNNGNPDKCCTPDVCPLIIKNGDYTRTTGTLQYVNQVGYSTSAIAGLPPEFAALFAGLSAIRNESWQLFDTQQNIEQAFINITHAFDVPPTFTPFPVFFPTDANYTATTAPSQVAYTVNLRFFYNPVLWGRTGTARYVQINNCIVLKAPTATLQAFDNTLVPEPTGVFYIAGGLGFEDDGTTVLTGFAADGVTPITDQATLNNFLHKAAITVPTGSPPVFTPAIDLVDLQYTFQPNLPVLLGKNLVTLGCMPDVALTRTFVNTVIAGGISLNTALINNLINGVGDTNGVPNVFPDPGAAQECLTVALLALRSNLTEQGVAEFQATTTVCLNKLQNDTNAALNNVIAIGVNPCASVISLDTNTQFTTLPITISVVLNENSGSNVALGLPSTVGDVVASQLKAFPTFGVAGPFSYDGYGTFTSELTSSATGTGQVQVAFNNNIFCTNDLTVSPPIHTLQTLDYAFVYTSQPATGEPRRTPSDIAGDTTVGDS